MPENDPIGAAIADARRRLEVSAQGSPERQLAFKDLAAAERTQRAARRAAGENLLSEEARQIPVTMGGLEDLMEAVRGHLAKITGRLDELEAKAKPKPKAKR